MMNFKTLGVLALAVAAATCFANQAQAQETTTLPAAIERAFSNDSGDIYRNRGIDRQATFLFGLSYPEHETFNDSQAVNRIVKDAIRQRANTPILTQDLPNPYTSSVLTEMRGGQ